MRASSSVLGRNRSVAANYASLSVVDYDYEQSKHVLRAPMEGEALKKNS